MASITSLVAGKMSLLALKSGAETGAGRMTRHDHAPHARPAPAPRSAGAAALAARGVSAVQAAPAASAGALSYQRSERTSLYLTTQQGDVVELRIAARDSASASTAQASDGASEVAQFDLSASSKLKVSFSVKGELNSDELAAIGEVVKQVGEMAQEFFSGGLADAFAAAQTFAVDARQLASVALRMSLRETFTYSGASLGPGSRAVPAAALPTPTQPTSAAGLPAVANEPSSADALSRTMPVKPAAPASQVQGALDLVRGFLDKLMSTLGQDSTRSGAVDLSLKLKMFHTVVSQASAVTTAARPDPAAADKVVPDALPDLVPATLDALAATQAPPLQAVA